MCTRPRAPATASRHSRSMEEPTNDGEWYVLSVTAGRERRVVATVTDQAARRGVADRVFEVVGSTHDGSRSTIPGYVLIRCGMDGDVRTFLRSCPGVRGIVGDGVRLSETEVSKFLQEPAASASVEFPLGSAVVLSSGAFGGQYGVVQELRGDSRALVLVNVFGRETPIEVSLSALSTA